jgi:hypothetical protein
VDQIFLLQDRRATEVKCPKCESDNREGVNFREDGGAKSELVCSSCKAKIPLAKKICAGGDRNLTVPSKLAPQEFSCGQKNKRFKNTFPKGLTEKILSQKVRSGDRFQCIKYIEHAYRKVLCHSAMRFCEPPAYIQDE